MKLSKNTLSIIKNFAGINPNLYIKPGNTLRTVSATGAIMGDAEIEETFQSQFGIYDLNVFLGILSLFQSPDIMFTEKVAVIREDKRMVKFYGAGTSIIKEPRAITPDDFPDVNLTFDITAATFSQIQKAASTLSVPDFSIVGEDGTIRVQVADNKNATSNTFENYIGETDKEFKVNLKVEDFRFLPLDYQCSIRNKKVAMFQATTQSLRYYNAIGRDSTFGF